ncbi:MAG: DUF2889 domain-containing protein [Ignavibacteriales bacterium]|nr:DUF2889 domain-containing protein [Ignavibacteriales bacterium]
MTEIYERNINVAVAWKNEHEIITRASMLDLNHHIRVELTIDLQNEIITDAQAQMTKVPYGLCQFTLANIKKIIGMKIERGIQKELIDALGHSDGCTHMVDLAMEAIRLNANVMIGLTKVGDEWFNRTISEEAQIELVKPLLKNSCLPFKENNN